MANDAPFSQPGTDILTNYSDDTGGAKGDFRTTIPANFSRIKDAILGLHNRLLPVESQGAVTADNVVLRAGMNENFRVARQGESLFGASTPSASVSFFNSAAFTSGYTGGQVGATGAGTFTYVQSLFSGWMMAEDAFTNIGQVVNAGEGRGARFTFNGAMTYSSSFGGTIAAGAGGDFPGLYQVITRHVPMAALAGRALTVRLRYSHTAAIAAGNVYKLYIAYVDNAGLRQEALSSALAQTTGETVVSFSTGDTLAAGAFPGGVIPADATSVEIGLALTANAGAFTDDPWDIFEFSTTAGTQRAESSPTTVIQDIIETSAYYSQAFGPIKSGAEFDTTDGTSYQNPFWTQIIANGGSLSNAADVLSAVYHVTLPLHTPWNRVSTPTTTTIPDCRTQAMTGAVVSSTGALYYQLQFGAAPDNAVVSISPGILAGVAYPTMEALGTALQAQVTISPSATPGWLNSMVEPVLTWQGETACVIAPLNA